MAKKIQVIIQLLAFFTIVNLVITIWLLYPILQKEDIVQNGNAKYSWRRQNYKKGSNICALEEAESDITIESEWDRISVSYPRYIFSPSGWLPVISVQQWSAKKLRVFIIPHSHQDPGWLYTFDHYYKTQSKDTLDLIVKKLTENKSWTFVWSDVIFLEKWWSSAKQEQQQDLLNLVHDGRLEIVGGGWVMTDEAVSHYYSMLDQLIEGHQWLNRSLGVVPEVGWSIDPFGHSPTMTYILQRSSIKTMIINRVHFAIKRHLANGKNLEFYWQQAWDQERRTAIPCHVFPFLSYSIPHSCGPDPAVCCQLDFVHSKCFFGTKQVPPQKVTQKNIEKIAWSFWEQLQKKAELFKHNVLLIPHGDDFTYATESQWSHQFQNLAKIMEFMNNNKDMNTKVSFGTPSQYFVEILNENRKPIALPTLTGDFFTYNDRGMDYWSGYYTTRPTIKQQIRRVQNLLRSTEILLTSWAMRKNNSSVRDDGKNIQTVSSARKTLAWLHHHDAITGTSTSEVMRNYLSNLRNAKSKLKETREDLVYLMIGKDTGPQTIKSIEPATSAFFEEDTDVVNLRNGDVRTLLVYNTLASPQQSVLSIYVSSPIVTLKYQGEEVTSQTSPMWDKDGKLKCGVFELTTQITIPALSIVSLSLKEGRLDLEKTQTTATSFLTTNDNVPGINYNCIRDNFLFKRFYANWNVLKFGRWRIQINMENGDIRSIANYHRVLDLGLTFVRYTSGHKARPFTDKSGAYTFQPDGHAQKLFNKTNQVFVIQGPLFLRIYTFYDSGFMSAITLYNVTGPLSDGIYVSQAVDLNAGVWNNTEIALRIDSNVQQNPVSLCVDLNGFQMHRKRLRKKFGIQGNFYPMTSMAFIEDDDQRLSILSQQTHAVANLFPGTIDIMLDRKLMQGDWRGLNQGVTDNTRTISSFALLMEKRIIRNPKSTTTICFPSKLALEISDIFQNPPVPFVHMGQEVKNREVSLMDILQPLPHNMLLLNMRNEVQFSRKSALIIIHHRKTDCLFSSSHLKQNRVQFHYESTRHKIKEIRQCSIVGAESDALKNDTPSQSIFEIPAMEIKTFRIYFH